MAFWDNLFAPTGQQGGPTATPGGGGFGFNVPGLLGLGAGEYERYLQRQADRKRTRQVEGPLYGRQIGLAGQSLGLAAGMDPTKFAAERFAAQQKLLEPEYAAQLNDLMRRQQRGGTLGLASFEAAPGTALPPGIAANPQLAALYAAQLGQKNRAAYESLGEGQQYLDQLLRRGGMLQDQALRGRQAGTQAVQAGVYQRPKSLGQQVIGAVAKNPSGFWDVLKKGAGMIGSFF